jgi:hypothetical protein
MRFGFGYKGELMATPKIAATSLIIKLIAVTPAPIFAPCFVDFLAIPPQRKSALLNA